MFYKQTSQHTNRAASLPSRQATFSSSSLTVLSSLFVLYIHYKSSQHLWDDLFEMVFNAFTFISCCVSMFCALPSINKWTHQQSSLFAQQTGDLFLQFPDSSVVIEYIVAHRRPKHGFLHLDGRVCDGVAAHVYGVHRGTCTIVKKLVKSGRIRQFLHKKRAKL